jgi:hypothetical protein
MPSPMGVPMTDPITDEDLEVLVENHRLPEAGDWDAGYKGCHECSSAWPCPTARLIARLDAAEARA